MVGVPRSKGCRLCVQRRVKCDQTRPICNNCRKGNRPCPGYGQDLKFRDESARLRQKFTNEHLTAVGQQRGSSPSVGETNSSDELDDRNRSESLAVAVNHQLSLAGAGIESSFSDKSLAQFLTSQNLPLADSGGQLPNPFINHNADSYEQATPMQVLGITNSMAVLTNTISCPDVFQEQLLALFAQNLAPTNRATSVPNRMHYYSRWLSRIPPTTGTNVLLDNAVRAVGLAHYGRLRQSDEMIQHSRKYYGKALHCLNSSLMDRQQGMSGETLSATIFLSFYEMLASPTESWIRHAGGAGALMKMRGPAAHRYGIARDVYMAYRFTIVIQSFQVDTYCFLDSPEWNELAKQVRSDIAASKDIPEDRMELFDLAEDFFECMVRVPAIVHEAKHVWTIWSEKGFPNAKSFAEELRIRTKECRARFKTIFAQIRAVLSKLGLQATTVVTEDPVFPTSYEYPNVYLGSTITGYWTILMLLNLILSGLEQNTAPENLDLYKMESHDAAVMSCRSVSYMLGSSFLGPFFVVFALRMALYTFHSQTPEFRWVVRKLHEISQTHIKMASHLPGWVDHGSDFQGSAQINVKTINGGVPELEIVPETEEPASKMGDTMDISELM